MYSFDVSIKFDFYMFYELNGDLYNRQRNMNKNEKNKRLNIQSYKSLQAFKSLYYMLGLMQN